MATSRNRVSLLFMKISTLSDNHSWIYALFWALVFLLNTGPHWETYLSTKELLETVSLITVLQLAVAAISLKILIPKLLNKDKKLQFFVFLFILVFISSEINILVRYLYIEKTYPDSYETFLKNYGHMMLFERMFSLWSFKYIFFTKLPLHVFPAAILIANNFYQKQRDLLKLNQQKQQAELEALKNQLNPHFIFNTLNNLYALTLKKSDQAPMVIEKLSNILDYILYRCNDKFVSLKNEIKLIESYIDLEKIRYGSRMSIIFECKFEKNVEIAPLILLTLLENACKHSTSEELNNSTIKITLEATDEKINFEIRNSKPALLKHTNIEDDKIGLSNMKKQLDLLYPDKHTLNIENTESYYKVSLGLKIQ